MIHGRLDGVTGQLTDMSYRELTYQDDVPLDAMPSDVFGPWTYDAVNRLAVYAGPTQDELDKATLKAGYQSILADLDTIEAGCDAEITATNAIITGLGSPAAGTLADAVKRLAVSHKAHLQGTKLNVQNARKTMKGIKLLVT